jgi:hypothetical protein
MILVKSIRGDAWPIDDIIEALKKTQSKNPEFVLLAFSQKWWTMPPSTNFSRSI